MESPDNRREADDSYRAQRAGRSMCAAGSVAPNRGVTDGKTSELFINCALVSRITVDRWLDRLSGRRAWLSCRGDFGRWFSCRRFGVVGCNTAGTAMNLQFVIAVAVGGSIGSVARYLVAIESGRILGKDFPWGILIINITGSFLIGAFVGLFATRWDLPQAVRIFLTVGICGGYTTFSTFSLDSYYLMERGELGAALLYMIGSVILSISALGGGLYLTRL
jgi:CrcB protein